MRHHAGALFIVVLLVLPFITLSAAGVKTVLVTGFEPFGTYPTNPSQLVAEALNGTSLPDAVIVGIVLPVNFTSSVAGAEEAIEMYHPDVVMSIGLNAKATGIEVEKIGVNLQRSPLGDGRWSFPRLLVKKSAFLRFTSLDTHDIVQKIRDAGFPAKQSFFAGTYICNALFYGLLGYAKDQHLNTSVGFIHVPLLESQDPKGLPLGEMVDAVSIAIEESLG